MNGTLVVILNSLILLGIVASAIVAVQAKKLLDSVIALAATGSFVALEFLLLQAPDVAIAEASVGVVLSTVLFIIALRIHSFLCCLRCRIKAFCFTCSWRCRRNLHCCKSCW